MNEKYNGWTNYETWNVALWYNNTEPIYRVINRSVRILDPDEFGRDEAEIIVKRAFEAYDLDGTPDGVMLDDEKIDWDEIYHDLREMIA